jgi:hypothetical protein
MTEQMIADVVKIRTTNNKQALDGEEVGTQYCMHFEVNVGPADLEGGIDKSTVVGLNSFTAAAAARPEFVAVTKISVPEVDAPGIW